MAGQERVVSPRQHELLERAYRYALGHGVAELSLRPLATAIGSSPRVLLYLFGSKDGLIRALLARARADELAQLARLGSRADLPEIVRALWRWLSRDDHRALLRLWAQAYVRSLLPDAGPWAEFAVATVEDWLAVLVAAASPAEYERGEEDDSGEATLALAVLRGALLDLLATGDVARTTAAVERYLAARAAIGP